MGSGQRMSVSWRQLVDFVSMVAHWCNGAFPRGCTGSGFCYVRLNVVDVVYFVDRRPVPGRVQSVSVVMLVPWMG
jgi:hypothetical protein